MKTESRIPGLAYNRCFGYLFISAFCFAYLYSSPGERASVFFALFLAPLRLFFSCLLGLSLPSEPSLPFEPLLPLEPLLLSLSAFSFLWSFCCPLSFHCPWRHPLF
ncbi:MAG: hypothetical protein SPJ39_07710, partial [Prevotella sp.]|nr:hypothetical protein [Prevotella sp.]